jgi:PAS domain S-box-containing protein
MHLSDPANPRRRPINQRHSAPDPIAAGSLPPESVASLILEHVHDGVFATDLDKRITFWGSSAEALFGFSADEAIGRCFDELLPVRMADSDGEATLLSTVAAGQIWRGEGSVRLPDGRELWIESTVSPLVVDGQIVGGVSVSRDMTAQRAEAERYRTVVDALAEGVVVQGADGAIVAANPAARAILGWGSLGGRNPDGWPANAIREDGSLLGPEDHPAALTLRTGRAHRNELIGLRRPSGEVRWIAIHADPLHINDGQRGVVSSFEDVTHYRTARMEQLFEDRLRAALAEAVRGIATDTTLERSAQTICDQIATLPGIDFVGLGAFTGEDELDIIASYAPAGSANLAGQRLPPDGARYLWERAALGPWAQHTRELREAGSWNADHISLAMEAIAVGPIAHGGHVDGVLVIGSREREAARILVEKMPAVVAFSATSSALLAERLHTRGLDVANRRRIEEVLLTRGFHPVFQPVVHLGSRAILGYEALTRFEDNTPPDRVFAVASSCGLGLELEIATLEAAFRAADPLPANRFLDINVSPGLVLAIEPLRAMLRRSGFNVVLEITEHERIADYAALRAAVAKLGENVRLAVDDAGAGFASLRHIAELRPAFVKLDRGLVVGIEWDPARQALVAGMVHFAAQSETTLIAEGIETEPERAMLLQLGVAVGQGYLFGRPAGPDRTAEEAAK